MWDKYLKKVAKAIEPYKPRMCRDFLTSIANPSGITMYLPDAVRIVDLRADSVLFKTIQALLRKKRITPLTTFQRTNCLHLCTFSCEGKIISVMSILFAVVNKMPVRLVASIEAAASYEPYQSSLILDSLIYSLKRRRSPQPCIIVTQSASTPVADRFWSGKMTCSAYAQAIVFMFAMLSKEYKLYMDASCKILFV